MSFRHQICLPHLAFVIMTFSCFHVFTSNFRERIKSIKTEQNYCSSQVRSDTHLMSMKNIHVVLCDVECLDRHGNTGIGGKKSLVRICEKSDTLTSYSNWRLHHNQWRRKRANISLVKLSKLLCYIKLFHWISQSVEFCVSLLLTYHNIDIGHVFKQKEFDFRRHVVIIVHAIIPVSLDDKFDRKNEFGLFKLVPLFICGVDKRSFSILVTTLEDLYFEVQ